MTTTRRRRRRRRPRCDGDDDDDEAAKRRSSTGGDADPTAWGPIPVPERPGAITGAVGPVLCEERVSLDAIFKAYDVRGLYPEEIDETLARRIGNAFAHFTGAGR